MIWVRISIAPMVTDLDVYTVEGDTVLFRCNNV